MVPLKSLLIPNFSSAPTVLRRFNNNPAAHITVVPASSDIQLVMRTMEKIAAEYLLPGMSFSWGGLAYQEKTAGGASGLSLLGGLIMIFLILAALYEKWALPFIILLSIPFALLGALLAIWIRGIPNDIFCQIGLITLIGLSAKNAILIVEFAKMKREEGLSVEKAALEAANLRFRAVLMTSLTLIFGVLPLVFSSGAGALSRHSVGTGMLGGMTIATFLGVLFIPFFYKMVQEWSEKRKE
jgi:multidrug efflux pump